MNEAKIKAIERLYERIASGERLTDNEYEFINNYEIECLLESKRNKPKKNNTKETLDTLIKYGNKALDMLDKAFPNDK